MKFRKLPTRRPLRPWQSVALEYADKVKHPAWFMEMRLGKSLVAIRHVQHKCPPNAKLLILAPLSAQTGWIDELTMEGEAFCKPRDLTPKKRESYFNCLNDVDSRHWTLISYPFLLRNPDIGWMDWSAVILDESTHIANPKAAITKLCLKAFRDVPMRVILTGLPDPESRIDFFSQFAFLNGEFMGHQRWFDFRERLFDQEGYEWIPKFGAESAIRREVKKRAFVLHRSDILREEKVYERRTLELNAAQKAFIQQIESDAEYTHPISGDCVETKSVLTCQRWFERLAGGFDPSGSVCINQAKYGELESLLCGDLRKEQVVVWFRFRSEIEEAARRFPKAAIIHGDVSVDERLRIVRQFRSGHIRHVFSTEATAKMGVDFSVSDTAIYYARDWSLSNRAQSEDRIYGPGKMMLYLDLVFENSLDEDILSALRRKVLDSIFAVKKRLNVRKVMI